MYSPSDSAMKLRVLFQNRPDMFQKMGGDSIQLLKTKEHLERLGVYVDVSLDRCPDIEQYDLLHLFNITNVDATYENIIRAKRYGKKVVLSPIYWNLDEYVAYSRESRAHRSFISNCANLFPPLWFIRRMRRKYWRSQYTEFTQKQRAVLEYSDAILPNANAEKELLLRDFPGLNPGKFFVVPNGVDRNIDRHRRSTHHKQIGIDNYILSVGRIEERKNQYRLIKALSGTDIPLILVGSLTDTNYVRVCTREGSKRGNVYFTNEIEHGELYAIYSKAKVHALPSWYETPGLANLEAGLRGCNLALSDRGSVKEYFGDFAYYCDPANIESIRHATLEAYNASGNIKLSRMIKQKYSWDVVAKKTLLCYQKTL